MAINHATLSTKLGKDFGGIAELNTYRGTTAVTRVATLRTAYGTDPDGNLLGLADALTALQQSASSWATYLSNLTSATIISAVQDDRGVTGIDIGGALQEWQRQLLNAAQTFNDCPVNAVLAAASGAPGIVADYTFHTSTKDTDGKPTDFGIPDVYLLTVQADADSGGTRWAETLSLVSKANTAGVLDAAYPTGTGISTTLVVTDPALSGGAVTDGDFNNYVSASFTSWTRLTGNTSATVFQTADDPRTGASGFCLDLKSDGVNVTGVKQTLTLNASTVYSLHFVVKGINAALGTAKCHVSLRRADTDAVVTDDQGTAITVSSSTMTTLVGTGVYTHFVLDFATPTRLPSAGVYLDIRLADGTTVTTPATVNTECHVDWVVVQPMPALYTRGVRIVAYSGVTEPSRRDQWEYTVTLASGTISGYMIRWLDRTVGLASRSFKFPTVAGGTETILDSLIV